MTERRIAIDLLQQELAAELATKVGRPRPFNLGRIAEWELGKKVPSNAIVQALWELLDPTGPKPPIPVLAPTPIGAATKSGTDEDFELTA